MGEERRRVGEAHHRRPSSLSHWAHAREDLRVRSHRGRTTPRRLSGAVRPRARSAARLVHRAGEVAAAAPSRGREHRLVAPGQRADDRVLEPPVGRKYAGRVATTAIRALSRSIRRRGYEDRPGGVKGPGGRFRTKNRKKNMELSIRQGSNRPWNNPRAIDRDPRTLT